MKYNLKADIFTKYYDISRFLSSVLFCLDFTRASVMVGVDG